MPDEYRGCTERNLPLTSTSDLIASLDLKGPSRDSSMSPVSDDSDADYKASIVHRWTHEQSILCVACSERHRLLFCGTQDSLILVFDLDNYQKLMTVKAHSGSVLCLHLADNERALLSGGSDSAVRIWQISDLSQGADRKVDLYSTHTIYSLLDIGDIFSVTWIDSTKTVLFGAQNASISYVHLGNIKERTDSSSMPCNRYDKFFDSLGRRENTPIAHESDDDSSSRLIEVPADNILSYAHNGYVYAMYTMTDIDAGKCLLGGTIADEFNDVVLSAGGDGTVKLWGFKDSQMTLLRSLDNEEPVLCLATKEGEDFCSLYCGLDNGVVNVWDLTTFQLVRSLEVDKGDISSLALSDDILFIATDEGVCKKVCSTESNIICLPSKPSLSLAAFEIDGNRFLANASMDNSVTLWNVNLLDISCSKNVISEADPVSTNTMMEVLSKLVTFPTVSKQPARFMDHSRKCASFLKLLCKNLGATRSDLIPVQDGNPVVLATFHANKAKETGCTPRILYYGHYDVIAADHTDSWNTDPFQVTPINGYLYGRGTSDNKGPTLAALYAVAELHRSKQLECDAVFLIEGEEESGSYGFQDAVTSNKDKIGKIDWVLLSNSYWLDEKIPCLNYGLRGVVAASVEVSSDHPDRHSGVDGGLFREPTIDLINVLSKLNDDDGKVKLPNFYSTIRPMSKREMSLYEDITKRVKGVRVDELMTKWRLPSLTVHSVTVSGPGNSTVIPHAAMATLSIRLVPNQDINEVKKSLKEYLTKCFAELNTDNHFNLTITHEAEPWLADTASAAYKVLFKNVRETWEQEPLFIREGGSIPSIRFLEKTFDCEAAHLPTGQSSDNAHLNNERLRITNLFKAKEIWTRTFSQLPCKN